MNHIVEAVGLLLCKLPHTSAISLITLLIVVCYMSFQPKFSKDGIKNFVMWIFSWLEPSYHVNVYNRSRLCCFRHIFSRKFWYVLFHSLHSFWIINEKMFSFCRSVIQGVVKQETETISVVKIRFHKSPRKNGKRLLSYSC